MKHATRRAWRMAYGVWLVAAAAGRWPLAGISAPLLLLLARGGRFDCVRAIQTRLPALGPPPPEFC
jgi:hypothetical protein